VVPRSQKVTTVGLVKVVCAARHAILHKNLNPGTGGLMRCNKCLDGFLLLEEIHVTEGARPMYLHCYCTEGVVINRVIPVRRKHHERTLHRRRNERVLETQGAHQ
jgi:hypothetical protein